MKKRKHEAQEDNPQERLFWLGGVMGGLFLILVGGLITRQLIQYDYFRKMGERQSLRRVLLPAPRGVIYDRNGVVLANNKPKFSLIVYLGELRGEFRTEQIRRVKYARERGEAIDREALQKEAIGAVLKSHVAPIERFLNTEIPLDLNKIEKHLNQRPLMPYALLDNLSLKDFARLTELLRVDAPIQLQVRSTRYYPMGDLATHVLGFVSMQDPEDDGSDLKTFSFKEQQGKNGIEKSFDDSLSGQMGYQLWLVDPAGFRYEPTESKTAQSGSPLTLTIDTRFQKALEKSFGKKIGAAAAMDVNTGEVLALVSKPSYNPNDLVPSFSKEVNARIQVHNGWINRAIQGLYPPGSTFKLMTSMAALESGNLGLDETIECDSFLMVGGRKFHEHRTTGYGSVNLIRALEVSCDVFFYNVGLQIGPETIMAEAKKYGLDKPTGIELPGETHSMLLPTPKWKWQKEYEPWYAGDTANVAIGQGDLLLTPLQMSCMVSSLARGDTLTRPTIIKKDTPAQLPRKPYSEALAKVVEGMKAALATGTGRLCRVDGLTIAGKTGTAQVKVNGLPMTVAWFVGFAPADNPQVAISVVVEGTSVDDEYEGGTTAAPIARSFFEKWKAVSETPASDKKVEESDTEEATKAE